MPQMLENFRKEDDKPRRGGTAVEDRGGLQQRKRGQQLHGLGILVTARVTVPEDADRDRSGDRRLIAAKATGR